MILKKLIAMCKKHKIISMFEDSDSGLKWLSAGRVAVCLGGDCALTPDDILFFLEVPEESRDKYYVTYEENKSLPTIHTAETVERLTYSLNMNGEPLQPFATSRGILFVNMKSLAIFADSKEELKYRFTYWNETPVLLVMKYCDLIGIIPPVKQDYEKLLEFTHNLHSLSDLAERSNFLSVDGKQVSLFDNDVTFSDTPQDSEELTGDPDVEE